MPITQTHPYYDRYLPKWEQMRHSISGDVIYYPHRYLPSPFLDASEDRYNKYCLRAIYYNFTGRTATLLHGLIFRNEPAMQLPAGLEYLKNNVDGNQTTLEQQAKMVGRELIGPSRAGLLVDYPEVKENITNEQKQLQGIAARIQVYTTENIINWKITPRGSTELVVLREEVDDDTVSDIYSHNTEYQYRELRMIEGVYHQRLVDNTGEQVTEYYPVLDGFRQTFDYIPFYPLGVTDNDLKPDEPTLYPLSVINIGHYRNSADYEEMASKMGQGAMHISGYIGESDTVYFGTAEAIQTETGGKVEIVQLSDNTFLERAMERKEQQAIQIGARLVFKDGSREAVGVEQIKASGENSVLANISGNITVAYEGALRDCARFERLPDSAIEEIQFDVNKEFLSIPMTLESYKVLQGLMMDQILTKETVLQEVKRRGIAEGVDVEEEIAKASENMGSMFDGQN